MFSDNEVLFTIEKVRNGQLLLSYIWILAPFGCKFFHPRTTHFFNRCNHQFDSRSQIAVEDGLGSKQIKFKLWQTFVVFEIFFYLLYWKQSMIWKKSAKLKPFTSGISPLPFLLELCHLGKENGERKVQVVLLREQVFKMALGGTSFYISTVSLCRYAYDHWHFQILGSFKHSTTLHHGVDFGPTLELVVVMD